MQLVKHLLPLVIHELAVVLVMFPSELVLWVVVWGVSMYLLPPCSGLSSYGWRLCILTENWLVTWENHRCYS